MAKNRNNIPEGEIITLGIPSETPNIPGKTDVIVQNKLKQPKKATKSITPYEPAEDIDDISDIKPPENIHVNLETLFDENPAGSTNQPSEEITLVEEGETEDLQEKSVTLEINTAGSNPETQKEDSENFQTVDIEDAPEEPQDIETPKVTQISKEATNNPEKTQDAEDQIAEDPEEFQSVDVKDNPEEPPKLNDSSTENIFQNTFDEEEGEISEDLLALLGNLSGTPDIPKYHLKSLLSGKIFDLSEENTVGKGHADIPLTSEFASKMHAKITIEDGDVYIEDMGSRNGTFYQDEPVSAKTKISLGDSITFGDEVCVLEGDTAEKKESSNLSLKRTDTGDTFEIFDGMKIGRKYYNDIVIPKPDGEYVSAKHAVIEIDGEDVILMDDGSSNGTTVNGEEIKRQAIHKGDVIKFADIKFTVV